MKKFLLLVVLVAHTISAQIISKDNTFASNGIHSITGNIAWSKMIQSSNGSIYFTYAKNNPATGLSETILSKLNPDGTTDSSFGNTGVVTIVYYSNDSQMKVQPMVNSYYTVSILTQVQIMQLSSEYFPTDNWTALLASMEL